MNETYKKYAVIIGVLFIFTTLVGMIDAYYVAPEFIIPITNFIHLQSKLLIGVFSVLIMSIGIVFIAITFFPIVKKHSQTIAITYVVLRTIECLLLILGAICYLYIIALSKNYTNETVSSNYAIAIALAIKMKYYGFQIAMIILGIGSLFLCYSLYISQLIPRFLSIWGAIGYASLLISAILDICGVIDTTTGLGSVFYVPGGLWELIIFPLWLFIKGFNIPLKTSDAN